MSASYPRRLVRSVSSAVIVALVLSFWILGSSRDWWRTATIPRPMSVWREIIELPGSNQFRSDFRRTTEEMLWAFSGGVIIGGAIGFAFWRIPLLGRAFEPYLVALYAVPLVVFYPVLLVTIGINQWPIVILSTAMAAVPMALNTWTGFRTIPPVYLRLSESLQCSRWQSLLYVAVPAAAPLVFAGIRLASVYALIGVIAMEFVVAGEGLGFRIRYDYELFQEPSMFAYIVVVFVIAIVVTAVVTWAERRASAHRDLANR